MDSNKQLQRVEAVESDPELYCATRLRPLPHRVSRYMRKVLLEKAIKVPEVERNEWTIVVERFNITKET